jgi:hypothetical protein
MRKESKVEVPGIDQKRFFFIVLVTKKALWEELREVEER